MSRNKTLISVISFFLLLTLLLVAVPSCSSSDKTALSSGSTTVTEGVYRYWYIKLKAYYVDSYSDVVDSQEFWQTEAPNLGITYAEFIDDKIETQIHYYLAGNRLFAENDLSTALKSEWTQVKASIDEEINDAITSLGSRSKYDEYLDKKYGIDTDTYRKARLMEQKFYLSYDYFFNSVTGIELATEAEIDAFYLESYALIKYYMILKNYAYRLDASGNRVMDSGGNYIQDELSEEEKAAQVVRAASLYESIKNGESIDTYIKADYPDLVSSAPNGFYVLKNEYYGYLFTSTIINAAFDMKIGDTVLAENEDAYFIIQRYSLPEKAYQGSDMSQFDEIGDYAVNDKFEAKFAPYIEAIVRVDEICDKYSVTTVD